MRTEQVRFPQGYGTPSELLAWEDVRQRLVEAKQFWFAFERPGRSPHVTPLDGVWFDDTLVYGGSPETLHRRLATEHPKVTVNLPDPWKLVVVEGEVHETAFAPEVAEEIAGLLNAKFPSMARTSSRRSTTPRGCRWCVHAGSGPGPRSPGMRRRTSSTDLPAAARCSLAGMHFTEYDTRVAAYAVIVDDEGRILLSWFNGNHRTDPGWTLPGGGVDYGEQLTAAVVREVKEETGYDVEVGDPLTTNVYVVPFEAGRRPYQSTRVIFGARIVGGVLGTLEVGGTTDFAEWVPVEEAVATCESTADIVGLGIDAWKAHSTQ